LKGAYLGPAVDGRELARLPLEDANSAVALLNGASFDGKKVPMPSPWQLSYSGIIVNCRDEQTRKAWRGSSFGKGVEFPLGRLKKR